MPVVGNKQSATVGGGIFKDPIYKLAKAFTEVADNIRLQEQLDIFSEATKVAMNGSSSDALKSFFMENSCADELEPEELELHHEMMEMQFNNDRQAVLEAAPLSAYNPVIGISFPMHKNILMNNVFEKAMPKFITPQPKFTITMERRLMTDANGETIDMFKDQHRIYDMMQSSIPYVEVALAMPEQLSVNVLAKLNASELDDNISIDSHISGVVIESYVADGEDYKTIDGDKVVDKTATAAGKVPVVFPVMKRFHTGYGEHPLQMMETLSVVVKDSATTTKAVNMMLAGFVEKNRFSLTVSSAEVTHVIAKVRIDASSAMVRTPKVSWDATTIQESIPDAAPINVPMSPDEIKDVSALYNVNQMTKVMSLINLVLSNVKDDGIKKSLDESFVRMSPDSKNAKPFDFKPRDGYALDHVEWRSKTFMDFLDSFITPLLQVLNDPNMTITILGRSELISKITPKEYTFQTPSSVGPIELDYVKTVVAPGKRVYQFISSDKLRNSNNLIVILCPRNTDRIIYRVYDYHMFVSNDIRNVTNYALPAVHAYERWKFVEYQPVQGRIQINNVLGQDGLPTTVADPIGDAVYKNNFDIDYQ